MKDDPIWWPLLDYVDVLECVTDSVSGERRVVTDLTRCLYSLDWSVQTGTLGYFLDILFSSSTCNEIALALGRSNYTSESVEGIGKYVNVNYGVGYTDVKYKIIEILSMMKTTKGVKFSIRFTCPWRTWF